MTKEAVLLRRVLGFLMSRRMGAEQLIVEIEETLSGTSSSAPPPPPECKTLAEKTAYAFGWWKALESVRAEQPAQEPPTASRKVKHDPPSNS